MFNCTSLTLNSYIDLDMFDLHEKVSEYDQEIPQSRTAEHHEKEQHNFYSNNTKIANSLMDTLLVHEKNYKSVFKQR